jgi:hypothetical protein
MLRRSSSVFKDMFSLPQVSENVAEDGSSANQPLILSGDTSLDFRELFSIVYAL